MRRAIWLSGDLRLIRAGSSSGVPTRGKHLSLWTRLPAPTGELVGGDPDRTGGLPLARVRPAVQLDLIVRVLGSEMLLLGSRHASTEYGAQLKCPQTLGRHSFLDSSRKGPSALPPNLGTAALVA